MMKYLALHETAVLRSVANQLRPVNEYHKNKFGMKAKSGWYVGYNDFCDTDGSLTHIRDAGEETSAIIGHNHDTIHICVAFNGDREYPSDKQLQTVRNYISKIKGQYPDIKVVFHRDLQKNRTCPGRYITKDYLDNIILQSEGLWKTGEDLQKQREIRELSEKLSLLRKMVEHIKSLLKI